MQIICTGLHLADLWATRANCRALSLKQPQASVTILFHKCDRHLQLLVSLAKEPQLALCDNCQTGE